MDMAMGMTVGEMMEMGEREVSQRWGRQRRGPEGAMAPMPFSLTTKKERGGGGKHPISGILRLVRKAATEPEAAQSAGGATPPSTASFFQNLHCHHAAANQGDGGP